MTDPTSDPSGERTSDRTRERTRERGPLADPRTLLGSWHLARLVEDRLAGAESRVEGRLELGTVAPGCLRWQETGRWHQASGEVDVRRGLWIVEESGAWWVRFEDGRDFHPWVPGDEVVHPCGADTYRGMVSGTPSRWSVRWEVSGPGKDYTMTTVLSPSGHGPGPGGISRGAVGPSDATPPAGTRPPA